MKKLTAIVFAILLLCGLSAEVFAAQLPDLNEKGSITLSFIWEDYVLDNGKLSMYKIGDIAVSGSDCFFVLTDGLENSSISLEDPSDPELAETLEGIASAYGLSSVVASIEKGKAEFTDVEPGLYLITQSEAQSIRGFEPIKPFLISVPNNKDGEYCYDVEATPKIELVRDGSSIKGDDDSGGKLPQTGQLNWPVPVMAISGALMFLVGWLLRYGEKGKSYEA